MNILFISLGCDKNLVDSEYMIGMLGAAGYTITDDENDADAVVMSQGLCLTYNLPTIGDFTCILGQGLSAYWFWWSESSPYSFNFCLDNN